MIKKIQSLSLWKRLALATGLFAVFLFVAFYPSDANPVGQSFAVWFPSTGDQPEYVLDVSDGCAEWSSNVLTTTGTACGSGSGSGFSTTSADYWAQNDLTLTEISDVDGGQSTNDLLYWDGDSWANTATTSWDTDTTYTAGGTLLDLTGTTFSINEGTLTDGKICTYEAGTGIECNYTDISGGGGGSGFWATSTDNLRLYPVDLAHVTILGSQSTSTDEGAIFEVSGLSVLDDFIATASSTITSTTTISGNTDRSNIDGNSYDLRVDGYTRLENALIGTYDGTFDGVDYTNTNFIKTLTNPTSEIQFVFGDADNEVRFALAESGTGKATYNPRSMIIAGPWVSGTDQYVFCSYWGFWALDCNTGGTGADLGVQDDLQVLGNVEIGGTLTASSTLTLESLASAPLSVDANGVVVASSTLDSAYIADAYVRNTGDTMTGQLVISGVATDITSFDSEDLTIRAGGAGTTILSSDGGGISLAPASSNGGITLNPHGTGDITFTDLTNAVLSVDATGVVTASTTVDQAYIDSNIARDSELHDAVTFTGSGTYISLSGQQITVDPITESDISDLGAYITDGSTITLGSLADVATTGISAFDVLYWDGSNWVDTATTSWDTDTTCDGASCDVTNTGTLDGIEGADFFTEAEYIASTSNPYITTMANLSITESQISDLTHSSSTLLSDNNSFTGDNTFTDATSTNFDITGLLTFNGVTASTWAAFCETITGSADLCDGSDATGSGGAGTISTSTTPTIGQIPYWTTSGAWPETLGSVATSSITYSAPITTSGTAGYIIGGSGFTLDIDDDYFIQVGTTSVGSITTLSNLSITESQISDLSHLAFPWTPSTTYGVTVSATGTPLWLTNTLYSSSTAIFDGNVAIGKGEAPTSVLDLVETGTPGHPLANAMVRAYNTDNSLGTEDANFVIGVGGSSGGDPTLRFDVDGVQTWSMGTDNSDSDTFKLYNAFDFSGTPVLTVTTAGAFSLPNLTNCDTIDTDANGLFSCGTDSTGSGGAGTISTSTTPTIGQIPYWTSSGAWPETLGSVATSSITYNAPITTAGTAGYIVGGSGFTLDIDDDYFIQVGTTSVGSITTLSNLTITESQVSDLTHASSTLLADDNTWTGLNDFGGFGTALGFMTPSLSIADSVAGIAGVQMYNADSGTTGEFRFVVTDDAKDQYVAFSMPSTGNTGTLFGETRSAISSIFVNSTGAGTDRKLAIGTVHSTDVILGTNNTTRVTIDTTGGVTIAGLATGGTSECVQADTNGLLSITGSACGGGSGDPIAWTTDTNFGATAMSTSTPIWFKNAVYASSTAIFTTASSTGFYVDGVGATDHWLDANGLNIGSASVISFNGETVLDESTGFITLWNIDFLDAATEATIESAIDTLSNLTTTGALNSGSITSGFGNIDNGSSNLTSGGTITFGGLATGGASECVQANTSGVLSTTGAACGGGSGDPFAWTTATNFGVTTSATGTPMWFQDAVYASSTLTVGAGGAGDSDIQFGPSGYEWTIGFDDTDDSFQIASSTALGTNPAITIGKDLITTIAKEEVVLYQTTIASTSVEFVNGGSLPLPPKSEAYEITRYECYVTSGTSVVLNMSDGTNDTETITCATTITTDTDVATNDTATAQELMELQFGTITGTVDYVSFTAYGVVTR